MNRKVNVVLVLVLAVTLLLVNLPTSAASAAGDVCDPANAAWIGTFGFGMNCVDEAGFHSYNKKTAQLQSDLIKATAACGKEGTLVAHALGVDLTPDGKTWKKLPKGDWTSIESLTCAENGDIWVAHYKGVSQYANGKWTKFEAKELGSGKNVDLVKDIAIAPDGKVWVVTSNSIAAFGDSKWTVYEKGKGFDKEFFLEKIVVDGKGTVWAGHSSGVLTFNDGKWSSLEGSVLSQIKALKVDSKGNVWVGTYAKGVSMFDGKTWTTFDEKNSELSTDRIRALAIDAQDRVWIGTEWGLNVFDGKEWKAYHMHTSDLADNGIVTLLVNGNGPTLPEPKAKKNGSLTGIIESGKDPVANTTVQLCSEFVSIFSGKTPCEDQPLTQKVQTDEKGAFTIKDVPPGRYGIVVQGKDGKWTRFGGLSNKIEIQEGKTTDLEDIDIAKKS